MSGQLNTTQKGYAYNDVICSDTLPLQAKKKFLSFDCRSDSFLCAAGGILSVERLVSRLVSIVTVTTLSGE